MTRYKLIADDADEAKKRYREQYEKDLEYVRKDSEKRLQKGVRTYVENDGRHLGTVGS